MATTPTNLFDDLKSALTTFKNFLDQNVPTIKPAIQALRSLIPQITDLLNKLIDLMNSIKTEVDRLASQPIPGVEQVSQFTQGITSLLTTAKNLLPDQAGTIDDVLSVAQVVSSLPSVGQIKAEIDSLIDAVVTHLRNLNS
ncbi:MAG: hypothetical protein U0822_24135 [Anaerolineae bacterium]